MKRHRNLNTADRPGKCCGETYENLTVLCWVNYGKYFDYGAAANLPGFYHPCGTLNTLPSAYFDPDTKGCTICPIYIIFPYENHVGEDGKMVRS